MPSYLLPSRLLPTGIVVRDFLLFHFRHRFNSGTNDSVQEKDSLVSSYPHKLFLCGTLGSTNTLTAVRVDDCNALPCLVYRGTNVTVEYDYIASMIKSSFFSS